MVVASTFVTTVFLVQLAVVHGVSPDLVIHDYPDSEFEDRSSKDSVSNIPEDSKLTVKAFQPPWTLPPPIQYLLVNVPEEDNGFQPFSAAGSPAPSASRTEDIRSSDMPPIIDYEDDLGPSESGELTDNGIDEAPLDEIINTWDCEEFRSFLEGKFEEYKHVVPQLIKSTDPSTIVGVTQIEGAIYDWECERLRNFIKRQFDSQSRSISSPTSSRVMHPRAERAVEEEKSSIISLHDQDKKEADDSKVSFMTMDDEGNVVDIFGLIPSDEEFIPCLECYNSYLTENMESWKKALSKNKLPKPLGKIAKEIGLSCRPKCGKKMPSNKKLKQILKAHVAAGRREGEGKGEAEGAGER